MVDLILKKFKLGDICILDKSNPTCGFGFGALTGIAEYGILYFN